MKRFDPDKFLTNKYNYLLITEIAILLAYPFLHKFDVKFPFTSLVLLIAIAPALWVGLSRKFFIAVISIGVLAFTFDLFASYRQDLKDLGRLILLFLYALFIFLASAILISKISSKKTVTADTIKGGISVYFLIGLFWAMLYMIVLTFDPDAFTNVHGSGFDSFYYSFITLTTLGYGDYLPQGHAKLLAATQAIAGFVYFALIIGVAGSMFYSKVTQKIDPSKGSKDHSKKKTL